MKTPEEMAKEYCSTTGWLEDDYVWRETEAGFLAGYKAAENHFRDATKKVTDDYIETASNEAKELIAKFGLKGNEDVLIKALVAAYCSGVDAVDGYLRNSLSAYRASVKSQQWISVKDRLPNVEKTSRSLRRESSCVLIVSYDNVYVAHLCEDWSDRSLFIFEACNCNCRAFDMEIDEWKLDQVTHWMPLPAPPKEEE